MSSHESRESLSGDRPAENGPDEEVVPSSAIPIPSFTHNVIEEGPLAEEPVENDVPKWTVKSSPVAPPEVPCECHCLHCGRTFMSDRIWFQKIINDPQGLEGFWMCPTPNCCGAGFTHDIFPTDPSHAANENWHFIDDEDDWNPFDDEEFDAEEFHSSILADLDSGAAEYDPDEPRYKELDEIFGPVDEDDLEGEEWKLGLQPGERPPNPDAEEAERAWRDEQRMYNEPDQRPRILDWTDREDRKKDPGPFGGFRDDEIPF